MCTIFNLFSFFPSSDEYDDTVIPDSSRVEIEDDLKYTNENIQYMFLCIITYSPAEDEEADILWNHEDSESSDSELRYESINDSINLQLNYNYS